MNPTDEEKRDFIRDFINRAIEKEYRQRQILLNAVKRATKGKKLKFKV